MRRRIPVARFRRPGLGELLPPVPVGGGTSRYTFFPDPAPEAPGWCWAIPGSGALIDACMHHASIPMNPQQTMTPAKPTGSGAGYTPDEMWADTVLAERGQIDLQREALRSGMQSSGSGNGSKPDTEGWAWMALAAAGVVGLIFAVAGRR